MKITRTHWLVTLAIVLLLVLGLAVYLARVHSTFQTIHSGWQTTVATEGQAIEALKSSEILAKRNVNVTWVPFLNGPPMIQSALAHRLDVTDAAAQPTLSLVAQDPDWVIVAHGTTLRIALVVPPDSPFHSIADLKGRQVGVPIGSTNEVFVVNTITAAGLQPSDFDIVNVGPPQNVETVQAGTNKSWGELSAVAVWEPQLSILESQNKVRIVAQVLAPFYITMRKSLIQQNPTAVKNYLCAFQEAWPYYGAHQAELDQAYIADSGLQIGSNILDKVATADPNVHAKSISDVDLSLNATDMSDLQTTSTFLKSKSRIPQGFDLTHSIDSSVLPTATDCLKGNN